MGLHKNSTASKELGAMEDVRHVAYAYHEVSKDKKGNDNEAAVVDFFDQMDKNGDDRIYFDEFKGYLKTVDCAKYGSDKDFFEKLAGEKDYLVFSDVVTLLYVISSGRPFCEKCKRFVEGLFFTCVTCFEKEKDYYYNFCPCCYCAGKNHQHCHKEFMDPVSLLRLKAKRESVEPQMIAKVTRQPSDESKKSKTSLSSSVSFSNKKDKSRPSNSNAIVVQNPQYPPIKRPDRALELMQFAVGCTTIAAAVSQFCTIM